MNEPLHKYCFISTWGDSLPIAWHLQMEGKQVMFGLIDDMSTVGLKETPEEHKKRMMLGKDLLDVHMAETLIEKMQGWEDKDEWFVFFDFNHQWKLADKVKDFKYGLFPTRFDYQMENDRNLAKEFVKANYPGVSLPEVQEFSKVEDAEEFLEDTTEFWALKGNSPDGKTFVPNTDNIDFAKDEIVDMLKSNPKGYESKGFILERQIRDGLEVCVEGMWWNGDLVATTIDIEHKAIGAGNTGFQVGCSGNLIAEIPSDSQLATLGLPEAIQKVAKRRRGLYFADANFIIKDGEFFYLECGFRPGYDAIVAELAMAGGATLFFDKLVTGETLFDYTYGVAVRGFNLNANNPDEGVKIRYTSELTPDLWPSGIYRKDGALYDCCYCTDAVLATGVSDDPDYAAIKAYDVLEACSYNSMYYRPRTDWFAQYKGAIPGRVEEVEQYIAPKSG